MSASIVVVWAIL
jgi:hypothetical protein